MKKFIVARTLPGAGRMTTDELKAVARTSVAVIEAMGKPYRWIESFVTDDTIYCVHEAEDEAAIQQHAWCGHFPVDTVKEVRAVITPATALEKSSAAI